VPGAGIEDSLFGSRNSLLCRLREPEDIKRNALHEGGNIRDLFE
jgi:hypothetical protein